MKQRLDAIDKILISGLPRTGTTFFGNILGSCEGVEYFFEPPMVNKLFTYVNDIDKTVWQDIFEDYCLNELLANSIAGRRLNFNANDDSHIFNYKSKAEIDTRLEKSWRAAELEEQLNSYTFAFKTPGVSNYLQTVLDYYSNWHLVIVFRTYEDILNSILVKGWFNDDNKNKITPYVTVDGAKIPTVISSDWHKDWSQLNEIERAMIYMNEQFKYLSQLKNYTRVDYNKFVENPKVLLDYFERLNVNPTAKTHELLKTIRTNEKDNSHLLKTKISRNILDTALQYKSSLKI
ncbi:sulfotransferase [Psychroserpens algicola]|uniref:sulfotransferase n=1 Tax=Psychroserpens algicola TaxID=1719034 RepID=UPI001952FB4A|nr:sulfotransferase [Psychroserpens algicola]